MMRPLNSTHSPENSKTKPLKACNETGIMSMKMFYTATTAMNASEIDVKTQNGGSIHDFM